MAGICLIQLRNPRRTGCITNRTLLVGVVLAVACHGAPATGRLQGDVYLVMQNGDVKRGAGNTVVLLRNSDSLDAAARRVCSGFASRLLAAWDSAGRTDSLSLHEQARVDMHTVLLRATAAHAGTGVGGHYRFEKVAPGKYALWAETEIMGHHYTWWAPVVIAPGDSLTKDLDNSTEVGDSLYCPTVMDSIARLAHVRDSVASIVASQQRRRAADSLTVTAARRQRRTADSLAAWLHVHTIAGTWERP